MAHRSPPRARGQLAAARRRFSEAAGLPFADLLPVDAVERAVRDEGVRFRDRLFPPAVTVWIFLSQVLDAAHCCRQAVARYLAWRLSRGLAPCSADAGAYCKARLRLPEALPAGWRGRSAASPRTRPRPPGACAAARSRWWMARPPPCPTRRTTRANTPSRGRRSPESASPWSAWSCCSRWRRARRWTRRWAPTAANAPASRPCSGSCTTGWRPAISCLPTAATAPTRRWPCAASAAATPCSACTSGAAWTSAAAGDWAPRTTWRPGRARPGRSG